MLSYFPMDTFSEITILAQIISSFYNWVETAKLLETFFYSNLPKENGKIVASLASLMLEFCFQMFIALLGKI